VADVASIHQLRPVRVLVSGADPAFLARTTDELTKLGFDVMSTTSAELTAEYAATQRVNVVLLDASSGVAAAAALASALDALPHRVRVLVAGRSGRGARRLGYEVIAPNASGEELAAAVHRAYRGGPARARRSMR
jgi:DNA-binding NarL/FixJ family response regulator